MLPSDAELLSKWAQKLIDGSISGTDKIGYYVNLFRDRGRNFESQRSARLAILSEADVDELELLRLYVLIFAPEKLDLLK